MPINLISIICTEDIPSAISSTLKLDGENVDYYLTVLSFSGVCILFAYFSFHRKLEKIITTCRETGTVYVHVNLSTVFSILPFETDTTFLTASLQ